MQVIRNVVDVSLNLPGPHWVPPVSNGLRRYSAADTSDGEQGGRGWSDFKNSDVRVISAQALDNPVAILNDARRVQEASDQTDSHVARACRAEVSRVFPSHPSSSLAGSGSKKASGILTRPRSVPGRRVGGCSRIGTIRATGTSPRAITISSPAWARSISCDSVVFAACIVTFMAFMLAKQLS